MRPSWFRLALTSSVVTWAVAALGQEAPRSELEQRALSRALAGRDFAVEAQPEGKTIEGIDVVVLDAFDAADPVPDFVNYFHVNSRDYVLKRELLLGAGDPYSRERVDESIRALRRSEKFSIVLIQPTRGSTPGGVRLLVVARDIWSLRLNNGVSFENDRLLSLLLNPTESNIFGTHNSFGLYYLLERDRQTFGTVFSSPQVGGSEMQLSALLGTIWPRRGGARPEGSYGQFLYYDPLRSRYDRWAWSISTAWLNEVRRFYRGTEFRQYVYESGRGASESLPVVYDVDRLAGEYKLVRSFGDGNKTNVGVGVEAERGVYRMAGDTGHSPDAEAAFSRDVLPTSDTRISPFVEIRAYRSDYRKVLNFETLGLQEDLRVGHDALLRLYPALEAAGSSRNLLGVTWAFAFAQTLFQTGIVKGLVRADLELSGGGRHNSLFEGRLRVASPGLGVGRLHLDLQALTRAHNYLKRAPLALGGDTRLRGYGFEQFVGSNLLAVNTELRSVSASIWGVEVGAALFHDLGDAFSDAEPIFAKQSLGGGLRFLIPQFDSVVFRVDWGMPITPGFSSGSGGLFVTLGQAFDLPQILTPRVTTGIIPG